MSESKYTNADAMSDEARELYWENYRRLRNKRDNLRNAPLDVVMEEALRTPREDYEGLPDRTIDQLMLKLALMGEAPSAIKYHDGFILIDTTLGQFWYISDGGYSNNAGPRFTLDQVL